jgi:hypothetical protein
VYGLREYDDAVRPNAKIGDGLDPERPLEDEMLDGLFPGRQLSLKQDSGKVNPQSYWVLD